MEREGLSEAIDIFFNNNADVVAKATLFVKRTSKLTGSIFLKTLVFGFLDDARSSLNDLTAFCKTHFHIEISSQGLNERIDRDTVLFLKKMFRAALDMFYQRKQVPIALLNQFPEVNISDSTSISLPECLATRFPGCGGDASPAGLKLQLVCDFLSGRFKGITLTNGITPDQKSTLHIKQAQRGSLNLFDLGYFALEHLNTLADKGAYFLCRLLVGTNVYHADGTKVNLMTLLRNESRHRFELALCLGKTLGLPCRVCFFRAPEEVTNRRRQKAKKVAAKKGRTPSKLSLELMGWTIFLTNVPASMLSLEHVALVYRVRWQIELLFKLWKSHMKIHLISGFRKERVLVELYAKLIGLILFEFLAAPLRRNDVDLSPTKAFKRFARSSGAFAEAVSSLRKLGKQIAELQSTMLKFARREKRKTRLSTCQMLLLEVGYYA